MTTVALFGGSFSPVHAGHIMVASYLAQFTPGIDEVWLLPASRNPLKTDPYLLSDADRVELLRAAVAGQPGLSVNTVELSMPVPSYTVDTLRHLADAYPDHRFLWAVGSDNWLMIERWKDWREIITRFGLIVYPRPGYPVDRSSLPEGVMWVDAPQIELSSTFIRSGLASGRDMSAFLPAGVWPLLRQMLGRR